MTVLKNTTDLTQDLPTLGVVVAPGDTVDVPEEFTACLVEAFAASKAKTADVTPDPQLVAELVADEPYADPPPGDDVS